MTCLNLRRKHRLDLGEIRKRRRHAAKPPQITIMTTFSILHTTIILPYVAYVADISRGPAPRQYRPQNCLPNITKRNPTSPSTIEHDQTLGNRTNTFKSWHTLHYSSIVNKWRSGTGGAPGIPEKGPQEYAGAFAFHRSLRVS